MIRFPISSKTLVCAAVETLIRQQCRTLPSIELRELRRESWNTLFADLLKESQSGSRFARDTFNSDFVSRKWRFVFWNGDVARRVLKRPDIPLQRTHVRYTTFRNHTARISESFLFVFSHTRALKKTSVSVTHSPHNIRERKTLAVPGRLEGFE